MHDVVGELLEPVLRMQHVLLKLTQPAGVETVARQILVRGVAERDQCTRRQLLQSVNEVRLFGPGRP